MPSVGAKGYTREILDRRSRCSPMQERYIGYKRVNIDFVLILPSMAGANPRSQDMKHNSQIRPYLWRRCCNIGSRSEDMKQQIMGNPLSKTRNLIPQILFRLLSFPRPA